MKNIKITISFNVSEDTFNNNESLAKLIKDVRTGVVRKEIEQEMSMPLEDVNLELSIK